MADTNQRPRGGMTLDAIFRQGVFPPWPEKFRDVSPTGWVGQIWRERQAALKIAQVPHEQNEMVRIAKVTGKQPVLAEPAVRQSVARNQQRELAQIHHRINAVAEQAAAARAKLKLIDHKNDTLIAAMGRQELRAMLRTMKPEERTAAMRKVTFRMAALEAEPELSGVPELLHSRLYEGELAAKFPAEVEISIRSMTWAGTGVLWTIAAGVPRSMGIIGEATAAEPSGQTFLQISDSHVGFDKPANPNALGTLEEAINKIKTLPVKPSFIFILATSPISPNYPNSTMPIASSRRLAQTCTTCRASTTSPPRKRCWASRK